MHHPALFFSVCIRILSEDNQNYSIPSLCLFQFIYPPREPKSRITLVFTIPFRKTEYSSPGKPWVREKGNCQSGRRKTAMKPLDYNMHIWDGPVKPLPRRRCVAGFTGQNRYVITQ